ncbi:MAG TPA: PAS domain S-box protein [bacterium]|nr:PAS domain S-box protein [bacterium]
MNRRILLIDDNQNIHFDFRKIFASEQANPELSKLSQLLFDDFPLPVSSIEFTIDSAYQGMEGAELARQARADNNPYAMAFVDVRMPPGWDGVETAKHLWEIDPDLQLVLCTAFSDYSFRQIIQQLGVTDRLLILKKPFDLMEVRQLAISITEKWNLQQTARQATMELEAHRDRLDSLVHERTSELERTYDELKKETSEREQITHQLHNNELLFRLLTDNMNDLVAITDAKAVFTYVSPSYVAVLGHEPRQLLGKSFYSLIHPDDRQQVFEKLQDGDHLRDSSSAVYRMQHREGHYLWFETIGRIVGHEGDLMFGAVFNTREITDRILAEEKAAFTRQRIQRQQRAIVKILTGQSQFEVGFLDSVRKTLEIATKALQVERSGILLFTENREELQCINLFDSATNSHSKGLTINVHDCPNYFAAVQSSRAIDATNAREDSRTRELLESLLIPNNISSLLDAAIRSHGDVAGVVCFQHTGTPRKWEPDEVTFAGEVADYLSQILIINKRKQAENALRESEERFRTLHEASFGGIGIHDNFILLDANRSLCRMMGYSYRELINTNVLRLIAPEWREIVSQHIEEKLQKPYEATGMRKDGSLFPLEIQGRSLPYQGRIVNVTEFRDITERVEAENERTHLEAQLLQSQKMEAIGRLAGGVAHDFNNILTGINGYAEILLANLDPNDPLYSDIEEILRAGKRATELTNQLLAFSRKQVTHPKIIQANQIIANAQKMLARIIGEDIDLVFREDPELWPIMMDPSQLDQILVNLSVNARDAMLHGGKLIIETKNIVIPPQDARFHDSRENGQYICLSVIDTGHGMDEETKQHLFEPFFTTKPKGKGTGLGLATVYGIVEQNDGIIEVESTIDKGTEFHLYLPRAGEAVEDDYVEKPSLTIPTGNETILLVEDEDMVRSLAKKILEMHNYKVLEASGAGEAHFICQNELENIDLLLSDVVMPRMSGQDLYHMLRKNKPQLKAVFMSGYTEDAIASHGSMEPGTWFIQKPFTIESLARKVREALDT